MDLEEAKYGKSILVGIKDVKAGRRPWSIVDSPPSPVVRFLDGLFVQIPDGTEMCRVVERSFTRAESAVLLTLLELISFGFEVH
jgi:hypothetical protein